MSTSKLTCHGNDLFRKGRQEIEATRAVPCVQIGLSSSSWSMVPEPRATGAFLSSFGAFELRRNSNFIERR
jgi:hypothetical protein